MLHLFGRQADRQAEKQTKSSFRKTSIGYAGVADEKVTFRSIDVLHLSQNRSGVINGISIVST